MLAIPPAAKDIVRAERVIPASATSWGMTLEMVQDAVAL
jgi:hypothetical protein